jgi:hypothetical protein
MKLSLEALKERAEAIASEELMNEISGGIANACHNSCHSIDYFQLYS